MCQYVCLSVCLSVWVCVRLSALNNRPCGIHPSPRPLAHRSAHPSSPPSRPPSCPPSRQLAACHPTPQPSDLTKMISHNLLDPGTGQTACSGTAGRPPPPTLSKDCLQIIPPLRRGILSSAANLQAVWPRNYSVLCAAPTKLYGRVVFWLARI